jgi:hypothetical protein
LERAEEYSVSHDGVGGEEYVQEQLVAVLGSEEKLVNGSWASVIGPQYSRRLVPLAESAERGKDTNVLFKDVDDRLFRLDGQ